MIVEKGYHHVIRPATIAATIGCAIAQDDLDVSITYENIDGLRVVVPFSPSSLNGVMMTGYNHGIGINTNKDIRTIEKATLIPAVQKDPE